MTGEIRIGLLNKCFAYISRQCIVNRGARCVSQINPTCVFRSEKRKNDVNFKLVDKIKSLLAILVFVLEESYLLDFPLRSEKIQKAIGKSKRVGAK